MDSEHLPISIGLSLYGNGLLTIKLVTPLVLLFAAVAHKNRGVFSFSMIWSLYPFNFWSGNTISFWAFYFSANKELLKKQISELEKQLKEKSKAYS